MRKKILLITTGGTIACKEGKDGLSPEISSDALLSYVPDMRDAYALDTKELMAIDSTNMGPEQWLMIAREIEAHYDDYHGFVISHGTDTMAYTACALSYLIQNSPKPIIITGAQKPIDESDTDARINLRDSIRVVGDGRFSGVKIVFGGKVIAGTRGKKQFTKSYHAFASINYPEIAVIQEKKIVVYINEQVEEGQRPIFYHELNPNVFLLKLIPGIDGRFFKTILDRYDAVIIESFGVGGLPSYEDGSLYDAVEEGIRRGKIFVMGTQVTYEGSDMSVYQVGRRIKNEFRLPEVYDLTPEAAVTKTMWALGQSRDPAVFAQLFYQTIGQDMMCQ